MRFLYPEFIYLMLFPAALLVYLITTNKDVLERIFDENLLQRLRLDGDALGREGHNTLLFTLFFLMTVALARPVIDQGVREVKMPGGDLIIALDLSRSMQSKDFYPNRLTFAKQKLTELLPKLPVDRIGMIAFTSEAFIAMPLSEDRESARFILEHLTSDTIEKEGTDIGSALKGAARLLRKSQEKWVLLVTDGDEEKRIDTLERYAVKEGLRLIVWMMATRQGAPILDAKGKVFADRRGKMVVSRANMALQALATRTYGFFIMGKVGDEDERKIVHFLQNHHTKEAGKTKLVHDRIELFYYPLVLALLIMPFALYSIGKVSKRVGLLLLFSSLSLPITDAKAGILDFITIDKAYKAYEKGEYRKSSALLEPLALAQNKSALWYDLGNSYYKSGRYRLACEAYSKVVTSDKVVEAAKLYNMGNCYVKRHALEKAAQFYKKSLALRDDPDARYNLALVEEALKKWAKQKRGEGERRPRGGDSMKEKSKKSSTQGAQRRNERGQAQAKPSFARPLTPLEERKWMQVIEKTPLHSGLFPLVRGEGKDVENPW